MKKLILCGLVLFGMTLNANGDFILNGSFENSASSASINPFITLGSGSTTITDWVVTGNSIDYIGSYWQASDGTRSLDLSGNAAGGVSQSVTLAAGTYELTFDMAGNPDGGADTKVLLTTESGLNPLLFNFTVVPGTNTKTNMGWVTQTAYFTVGAGGLNAGSITINFSSNTLTPYGPALDNVHLNAVPLPTSLALLLAAVPGLASVGWFTRRKTNVEA